MTDKYFEVMSDNVHVAEISTSLLGIKQWNMSLSYVIINLYFLLASLYGWKCVEENR